MIINRRNFIKQSAIAAAALSISSCRTSVTSKSGFLTGIQLYTVRDDMATNPLKTLQALAEMGYKHVEHAKYVDRKFYGWTATEFRKVLNDLGLKMPSGHTELGKNHWDDQKNDFTDLWRYTIEDAAIMGQQYVISPSLDVNWRNSEDNLKKYMDVFNKCGELCKKHGMKFGYHNHDFEFSEKLGDKTVYDIIMQQTDPDLVMHQLDIGNMYNGGAVAKEIILKYPGRFNSMHVKDMIELTSAEPNHGKYESTIVGTGVVNVKEAIELVKNSVDNVHLIIEQESYQGKTPLMCAKENLAILNKWGY